MSTLSRVDAVPGLWRLEAETNGYLLVRHGAALLIDCPAGDWAGLLADAGLPAPVAVLHTQVQTEHCGEWQAFPAAPVFVHESSIEVAKRTDAFFAACVTVWPESREMENSGEDLYGITGCVTARPPQQPLNVAGTLRPGETFAWEGIALEVIALPGSDKRAIGLYWREANVVFSGDLLHAGGFLVNFYDLERGYGTHKGYHQLANSLKVVADLQPSLLLPTTGPVCADPAGDIAALLGRMTWFERIPRRAARTDWQRPPLREFGRYKEVVPGIYQCTNFGNVVLYVDDQGRGLIVDPGPCVWLPWEESVAAVHADFDQIEALSGLKTIELAIITHYHGDHCQFSDLIRQRYGTTICATPDVAMIIEEPRKFRYPCTLDWYNFPYDHIRVDRRLTYEETFYWNDIPVTPIHTPGHCFAHTGVLVPWNGIMTACTGDTLQYGGGQVAQWLPFTYNDTAWPDRGNCVTYRRVLAAKAELILGGHGHNFFDPEGAILRDLIAVNEEVEALARQMVPDGDILPRMTPPGFDILREKLCAQNG